MALLFRQILVFLHIFLGIAFAASSRESSGIAAYDAKYVESLSRSSKNGIIRITDDNFKNVIEGPRDYTVILLLTADGAQYQCGFCHIVGPAFNLVGSSWHQDHPSGENVFFAIADISYSQQLFMALEMKHAPNLHIYRPTESGTSVTMKFDVYQFPAVSEGQAQHLADYLRNQYDINVVIHEPVRWDRVLFSVGTLLFALFTLKMFGHIILKFLQKKQIWTAVSLVAVLMFTAGHMFNVIRKVPYIISNGHGGLTYFVGGHSNQIAVETQIVAITYALMAFSVISMIVKVPKISDPQRQMLTVTALSVVFMVGFSFIMSKFHVKNGSYPFGLLPL